MNDINRELTADEVAEKIEDLLINAKTLTGELQIDAFKRAQKLRKEYKMPKDVFEAIAQKVNRENGSMLDKQCNADGTGELGQYNLEKSLQALHITARHNIITREDEISGNLFEDISPEKRVEVAAIKINEELKKHLSKCSIDKVGKYLEVVFAKKENYYNPILEKIKAVKWDNVDRIEQIYKWLSIPENDTLSKILVKKWLMMCYCSLYINSENTFPLDYVLVFIGEQGHGKSSLLRKLATEKKYFGDGLVLELKNKDIEKELTTKWITELGEMERSMRTDKETVKSFISREIDPYRNPYGRTIISYPRLTCFCGSCNNTEYLVDETGNRRFLSVPIPKNAKPIDVQSKEFREFDTIQLWSQVMEISENIRNSENKPYSDIFRLTDAEKKQLEIRNNSHMVKLPAEEEVADIIAEQSRETEDYEVIYEQMTLTDFIRRHDILKKFQPYEIRKALIQAQIKPPEKPSRANGKTDRWWTIPTRIPRKTPYYTSGNPYSTEFMKAE